MKYYAVTNDPAELMHYGVKGMKWGVIRTDAQLGHPKKPRSAAYKRASSKLSKMMKSGIKKAEAHWQEYNSPSNQRARAKKREAHKMDRYLEQARKGKLKYGKLTDAQVRRVTDRLNMERQARMLGSTNRTFKNRLGEAIGAGILSGATTATATIIGEKFGRKARLKTDRMRMEQQRQFDIDRERRQSKLDQERLDREFRNQQRKDEYQNSDAYIRKQAAAKSRADNLALLYEDGQLGTHRDRKMVERADRLRSQRKETERAERLQSMYDEQYQRRLGVEEGNREIARRNAFDAQQARAQEILAERAAKEARRKVASERIHLAEDAWNKANKAKLRASKWYGMDWSDEGKAIRSEHRAKVKRRKAINMIETHKPTPRPELFKPSEDVETHDVSKPRQTTMSANAVPRPGLKSKRKKHN